jgi:IS30 family transposase
MRKKVHRYTKDDYVFVYQMLRLRSEGMSYPKIGKMFNKDHSTILYWCKRFSVDIGTSVPEADDLDWRINKKPIPNKYKYSALMEETINPGKNYADYLKEAELRKKRPCLRL